MFRDSTLYVLQADLLSQELWRCQSESESERRGLEVRLEEQRLRLEGYERVERDLDDLVMQAAQCKHCLLACSCINDWGY